MNRPLALACAFALFILSGCAAVEKQAFNRQAHVAITSITILEPAPASGFGVAVINHPSLAFGLIGAGIYTAEMAAKSNSLDAAMKPLGWSLTDDLANQIATELTAAGYKVSRAKIRRDGNRLLESYKSITPLDGSLASADAWLDVATRDPLYVANSPTADYVPSIGLSARLVSAKDQTLLYREDFFYGFAFAAPRLAPVVIAADAKYSFPGHGDLLKTPPTTLNGVKEGVALLAKRIAADLARETAKASEPAPRTASSAPANPPLPVTSTTAK
jgi:hypothetical protein